MSDQVIALGKFVSLTYSIRDEAGNLLEQTDLPVGYIHGGQTELIGGLDQAVVGKRVGDQVEIHLAANEAFGPRDPDLTFTDDIENVPPEFRFVGAEMPMQNEAGDVRPFYITRIDGSVLTVDGNHPLAGKALHISVRVQEVRDPTEQELVADVRFSPSGSLH